MSDEEKLQKNLSLIRNAAGWTAEELGKKIGVTKQTISNLENNKTKMTKTQYLAIQMVLSQKIATSTDDLTLANIMKMIFSPDTENIIDYSAVKDAKAIASVPATSVSLAGAVVCNVEPKQPRGVSDAIKMLGLKPAMAVGAMVLGATITSWLSKALEDE